MAALVDTNVLVYRYDHRFPDKQAIATATLRTGIEDDSLRLSHQTILEFVAATTRGPRNAPALLEMDDARREAEELLREFPVLYPNDEVVRTALRGTAAYQLSWFDAHMRSSRRGFLSFTIHCVVPVTPRVAILRQRPQEGCCHAPRYDHSSNGLH